MCQSNILIDIHFNFHARNSTACFEIVIHKPNEPQHEHSFDYRVDESKGCCKGLNTISTEVISTNASHCGRHERKQRSDQQQHFNGVIRVKNIRPKEELQQNDHQKQ